jgi:hypothetical protein
MVTSSELQKIIALSATWMSHNCSITFTSESPFTNDDVTADTVLAGGAATPFVAPETDMMHTNTKLLGNSYQMISQPVYVTREAWPCPNNQLPMQHPYKKLAH